MDNIPEILYLSLSSGEMRGQDLFVLSICDPDSHTRMLSGDPPRHYE